MPLVVTSSLSLSVPAGARLSCLLPVFCGGGEMPTFRGTSDKTTPDVPPNADSVIPLFPKLINLQLGALRQDIYRGFSDS